MAKVKAPLLSMRASGTIGKNIVYAAWRGVPYTRQHVIPANPKTVEQSKTRDVFLWLNLLFRQLGALGSAPWAAASIGRPFTERNACIRSNLPLLRTAVEIQGLVGSPGVRGGPSLASFTPNPGVAAGSIDMDFTIGVLPTGWTLNKVVGFALLEQDPHTPAIGQYKEGSYTGVPPQTFVLTGLQTGGNYVCVGWAVYNRDDATLAYSPSMADDVIAT